MRTGLLAAAAVLLYAGTAAAQNRFTYKPIDTDKLLIQPSNAAATAATGTTTSVFRTVTRTIADTVENNGFVRTVNNLLGRREQPAGVQPGFSPLPMPGSYQSTGYASPYRATLPSNSTFGTTPAGIKTYTLTGR